VIIPFPVPDLRQACVCGFPGDLPAVFPYTVHRAGDALTAAYRCPACGRQWMAGWDSRAASWPLERAERLAA
jgi:hypothetical protein